MLLQAIISLALAAPVIDPPEPKIFVRMVNTPRVTASTGTPTTVELKFRVSDGFHINSNVPRSSYLIPTKLDLKVPPELGAVTIAYPAGKDFVFAFAPDEKLNVYSGEFPISADLKLAPSAKMGQHKIHGELTYQACNDRACFPPKKLPVTIEVDVTRVRIIKPRREPPPIDPTRGFRAR